MIKKYKPRQFEGRKAQVSIELIIILGLIFVIFLGVLSIAGNRAKDQNRITRMIEVKDIADSFSLDLNQVFLAGDGAEKKVFLPSTLRGSDSYNLTVFPASHLVNIRWNSLGELRHYDAPLISGNISGRLENLSGEFILTNVYGEVIVS
jgi:hypothetical protein